MGNKEDRISCCSIVYRPESVMQFRKHGMTECDGFQKGENSIALEQNKRRTLAKGFSFDMGMRSVRVFVEERSCLEGVYTVRRSER